MHARGMVAAPVDAKRKLDVAARVIDVLEHTPDSALGEGERAECVRIVASTRLVYDEQVDALSAEDRWDFVYRLMLEGLLPD